MTDVITEYNCRGLPMIDVIAVYNHRGLPATKIYNSDFRMRCVSEISLLCSASLFQPPVLLSLPTSWENAGLLSLRFEAHKSVACRCVCKIIAHLTSKDGYNFILGNVSMWIVSQPPCCVRGWPVENMLLLCINVTVGSKVAWITCRRDQLSNRF